MKWTIGRKIMFGFGLLGIVLAAIAITNYTGMHELHILQTEEARRANNAVVIQEGIGYANIAARLASKMIEADKAFEQAVSSSPRTILLFSITGFLTAIIIGVVIARGVSRPIARIIKAAEGIAKGDIEQEVSVISGDEIGQLAETFRQLVEAQQQKINAARQISEGNLTAKVNVMSNRDTLGLCILTIKEAITSLSDEVQKLVNAAVELVGHLGGMPAPAMIIDKGFNIRYLNKAGAAVLRREQSQLIGAKCFNHFKTSDCNTPKLLPNLPR